MTKENIDIVEVKKLTKYYGNKKALEEVDFSVKVGEILGFLGLNGAGKTTTMNIITGYIGASSGKVTVFGHDIFENPKEAKSCIGYLPEQPPLYTDMTVFEYLDFICNLKGIKKDRTKEVDRVCEKAGLLQVKNRMIRNLSKGYRQRVGIAQAIIGDPRLIILDEPTVGLDPSQIVEIRGLIKELGKTSAVIVSSHILSEMDELCDKILMIHQGRVIANDTSANLSKKLFKKDEVCVRIKGSKDSVKKALSDANIEFLGFLDASKTTEDIFMELIQKKPLIDIDSKGVKINK